VLSSRVLSALGASMSDEPVRPAGTLADAVPLELERDRRAGTSTRVDRWTVRLTIARMCRSMPLHDPRARRVELVDLRRHLPLGPADATGK
jgi:hypothetical protein